MLVLWIERKGASGATVREEEFGGAEGSRTPDPHNAIESCEVVMSYSVLIRRRFCNLKMPP